MVVSLRSPGSRRVDRDNVRFPPQSEHPRFMGDGKNNGVLRVHPLPSGSPFIGVLRRFFSCGYGCPDRVVIGAPERFTGRSRSPRRSGVCNQLQRLDESGILDPRDIIALAVE